MGLPRRRALRGSPTTSRSEASAVSALEALSGRLGAYAHVLTSPSRAARETAAALGLTAEIEPALKDCDYGRWRGLALRDVAARVPEAFAAWLNDPAAAPHCGETLAALILRVGGWLASSPTRDGATLAVTHSSVVRAAIVTALGAGSSAFWRIDVAPLSLAKLSGRDGRWNLVALEAR